MITNVKLTNKYREKGGEYYIPPNNPQAMSRAYKDLADYRTEEPKVDWHIETRGYGLPWHRMKA